MSSNNVSHPSVIWAQRKNCVFLTICLEDCKGPEIKVETTGIFFKGKGGSDGKDYETKLDFFGSILPDNSLHVVRPRNIEFCLKKEEEKFWPRLTKSQAKCPWLKIDFNKWKDEDDSDDEMGGGGGGGGGGGMGGMGMPGMGGGGDGTDFEEMMRQMGGLGNMGGGMPGQKPSLDDLEKDETDSDDDEDLPDLE